MLHALWRAFVDSFIGNDEKVATSIKKFLDSRLEFKQHILSDTKITKLIHILFLTKTPENHTILGRTSL